MYYSYQTDEEVLTLIEASRLRISLRENGMRNSEAEYAAVDEGEKIFL